MQGEGRRERGEGRGEKGGLCRERGVAYTLLAREEVSGLCRESLPAQAIDLTPLPLRGLTVGSEERGVAYCWLERRSRGISADNLAHV